MSSNVAYHLARDKNKEKPQLGKRHEAEQYSLSRL